ncbi:hypothetical protein [Streptomyces sp. NPDC002763]|uniref:NACHT N-terminal Helical domain 1-containing protein n=1 Tax=Streptomyces sp. NPDC002763 TaxID=3154427 RepID=UPI00332039EE
MTRSAAQTWPGGKRREQERRMDMAELTRLRVPGLRLQRSVERQFGEMADAVFDRLAPFLDREFAGLTESGREAVVNGVCDTFAAADLSDEAILAADANPAEVVRRVTRTVRPPVGLGEAEGRLYELLARTTSLGTEIARILEKPPDRSLFAVPGAGEHDPGRGGAVPAGV